MAKLNIILKRIDIIKPHQFFLFVVIFFGTFFVLINPLFQGPDEPTHFMAVARYANGYVLPEVSNNSNGMHIQNGSIELFNRFSVLSNQEKYPYIEQYKSLLAIRMGGFRDTFIANLGTVYPPFTYTHYIIVYFIGSLVKLNPFLLFILLRFVGLAVWAFLTYFAIKIIPKGKWFLAVLAILPMTLFIATTVTADNIANGLVFLGVAMIFNAVVHPSSLTKRYTFLLFLVILLTGVTKPTFFVVALLLLILPKPTFTSKKILRIASIALIVLTMLFTILWQLLMNKYLFVIPIEGVNTISQLKFILRKPVSFGRIIWNTYLTTRSNSLYTGFVGIFGWLTVPLPIWIIFGWLYILFKAIGVKLQNYKKYFSNFQIAILVITPMLLFLLLSLALYINWSPVKYDVILGLQGRYYIPIIALLIPLFTIARKEPTLRSKRLIIICTLFLYVSVFAVYISNYIAVL